MLKRWSLPLALLTVLALASLAIALFGFKQIKDSTEQPMLTSVSV